MKKLSVNEVQEVSGGFDSTLFMEGLSYAALGFAAAAAAPFVATGAVAVSLVVAGTSLGVGGSAVMGAASASNTASAEELSWAKAD